MVRVGCKNLPRPIQAPTFRAFVREDQRISKRSGGRWPGSLSFLSRSDCRQRCCVEDERHTEVLDFYKSDSAIRASIRHTESKLYVLRSLYYCQCLGFSPSRPPIIQHIVHRVAEATLPHRFRTQLGPAPVGTGCGTAAVHRADSFEAGAFEHRVGMAHRRERFDPVHLAQLTRLADEIGRDAGSTVGRVQHNPLQQPELRVHRLQSQTRSRILQTEIPAPQRQGRCWCAEDDDPDRPFAVPEYDHAAGVGQVVAAIMPPSEVRPIAAGTVGEPEIVAEGDPFFFGI